MKFFKALAAATAVAGALAAAPASAVTQLGFILDRSGSIGDSNWDIITAGLGNAIGSLIPLGGLYEISVVTFSSSATIDIDSVVVTDAASRTALANSITALGTTYGSTGSTNFADAFAKMQTALTNGGLGTESYVNFATDGVPNSTSDAVTARDALIAAGVDNISIEGIGSGVNAGFLTASICYPTPCDTTAPYAFPGSGFYIAVDSASEYSAAIGNKILTVTGQVPEPASLALLGFALAGMGVARRRSTKA